MINIEVLGFALLFITTLLILAQYLKLSVLGLVAGLFLLLISFWLLEPVGMWNGTIFSYGEINTTTYNTSEITSPYNITETAVFSEIETPYFDFKWAVQLFFMLGGMYLILEYIYKTYNM